MTQLRTLPAIAIALVGVMLGACTATLPPSGTTAMPETSASAPQPQPDTTTFCLGRFLIDLPQGSKLSGGNYKYDFAQVEKPVAMSLERFQQEISALEEKRRNTKHEKDPSLLRAIQRPDGTSVVMSYWEEPYSGGLVNVDGYKWVNGLRYLLRDEAGLDLMKDGSMTQENYTIKRMGETLSHLRPRSDTDIPKEPGYCFAGGFIADGKWRQEEAQVEIDIAVQPDAFVSVWFYPLAKRKHDKPLLDRVGGALQQLGTLATGVRVLRKDDRKIGEIDGQEYLVSAPNSGGMRGHSFVWETQGEGTLRTPRIKIELETGHQDNKGNAQQTRLSDEQAIKLWDRIVSSFRLRPVDPAPVKTSEAPAPLAPLGELAATGRTCPQTGWWECDEEARRVQGGKRQFLQIGDRMPHAILQGEPNMWQRLKGEAPTHRVGTVWKLVDYDSPAAPLADASVAVATEANLPLSTEGGGDSPSDQKPTEEHRSTEPGDKA